MLVAAICVACLGDQCRAQKAVLSAASLNIPTILPQMSTKCIVKLKCRTYDAGILLFTIIISYVSNIVVISLHLRPCEPASATGGERRQKIISSSQIVNIIDCIAPRARPVPLRGVWNIGQAISQRRRVIKLHITFVKHIFVQQDDDAGQNNRWYIAIAARLWRPYRLAFRRPPTISDADDSGACSSTRSATSTRSR